MIDFNTTKLNVSTDILRALAHPLRIKILEYIDQNENINVNNIYTTLGLEQSLTSQHLSILRRAGIVETERNGKFIIYNINYDKINSSVLSINKFLEN